MPTDRKIKLQLRTVLRKKSHICEFQPIMHTFGGWNIWLQLFLFLIYIYRCVQGSFRDDHSQYIYSIFEMRVSLSNSSLFSVIVLTVKLLIPSH